MAVCNFNTDLISLNHSLRSSSFLPQSDLRRFSHHLLNKICTPSSSTSVCCVKSTEKFNDENGDLELNGPKRLSQQSSWEAKDSEGRDYLYRLGKEADNVNIVVGAKAGVIDDLFAGNFLGRDGEISNFV